MSEYENTSEPLDVSNVGQTPPEAENATPFQEFSVTSSDSVDYPHPDKLRGATEVEHDGPTAVCPVCQHRFVP